MQSTAERPIDALAVLARSRATGELIATSPGAETHLYLHGGRVVWGIDSRRPDGFAERLHDAAGVAHETLREVLDECRRGRLAVAETLVAWGLTSIDGLRLAMLEHLRDTLTTLSRDRAATAFFLARAWPEPDRRLAFALDELGLESPRPAGDEGGSSSLARAAADRFDGLLWVEVHDDAACIDAAPASESSRVPSSVARSTLGDGADFLAVVARDLKLFGTAARDGGAVWCRVADGATLGGAIAALSGLDCLPERRSIVPQPRLLASAWRSGETPWLRSLERVAARGHEVLGALVLDPGGTRIAGLGYGELSADVCVALCRRRAAALVDVRSITDDARPQLVTGEPSVWCFGAIVAEGPDPADVTTAWLLVDRSASQGLGWSYLGALVHDLSSNPHASA